MAGMLRQAGADVVICPLLEIIGHDPDASPRNRKKAMGLDLYDHVIFVSRNAVRFGMPAIDRYWPQLPLGLTVYAVGHATAAELASWGIQPVVPDTHASEGLLALPALGAVVGQRILIVRGVGGRAMLGETLATRGALVDYFEVYERRQISPDEAVQDSIRLLENTIVVVYSGETLATFDGMLGDGPAARTRFVLVVPSKRMEAIARAAGFDSVLVAKSAEDAAMSEATLSALDCK
jgi:uroporphyrinogen-III synthase